MTEHDSMSGTPLTPNNSSDQKTNTHAHFPASSVAFNDFCDDFSEVQAINSFLYDVMLALHTTPDESPLSELSQLGLLLFLRYFRRRTEALDEKLAIVRK